MCYIQVDTHHIENFMPFVCVCAHLLMCTYFRSYPKISLVTSDLFCAAKDLEISQDQGLAVLFDLVCILWCVLFLKYLEYFWRSKAVIDDFCL